MVYLYMDKKSDSSSSEVIYMWEIIVALVIAIPVILAPAAFVWYLNVGGLITVWKETRRRNTLRDKLAKERA